MEARRQSIEDALRDWSPERISTLAELLSDFNLALEVHQRASAPVHDQAPAGAATSQKIHDQLSAGASEAYRGRAAPSRTARSSRSSSA